MNMFLALGEVQAVLLNSNLRAVLQLNVARCRSSNVSRSVAGLRHLTKNVATVCIELSVSRGELKSGTKELPGF